MVVMSGKDVYPRLNSLDPGFLKKDVIRYAEANGIYTGQLGNFPGKELLSLKNGPSAHLTTQSRKNPKENTTPAKKVG